jgi:hypothetical protein
MFSANSVHLILEPEWLLKADKSHSAIKIDRPLNVKDQARAYLHRWKPLCRLNTGRHQIGDMCYLGTFELFAIYLKIKIVY